MAMLVRCHTTLSPRDAIAPIWEMVILNRDLGEKTYHLISFKYLNKHRYVTGLFNEYDSVWNKINTILFLLLFLLSHFLNP